MNARCRDEILNAMEDIAGDKSVKVVVITGQEKYFCSGADINDVMDLDTAFSGIKFSRNFHRVFQSIEDLEKPVIAAISGFALGGGCELALACDLRILSERSTMGVPEVNIGALPAGGGTQKLPRLIGACRAKEMLFTGDRISAQEAYNLGLVNKVVPDGECLNEAKKLANKLAAKAPAALRALKLLVNNGMNMDLHSALVFESETFGVLSTSRDFKEGVSAFLEKREPNYQED